MSEKLSMYSAYRDTTKLLLRIIGLWPNEEPSLVRRLFVYAMVCMCTITTVGMIGFIRKHLANVVALTKGMGIMISFVTVILKIFWMIMNRQRVYELHQMLDIHFDNLLQDLSLSKNLLNGVTTFRRMAWTLTFFICLTCGIYVLTPLIFTVYQHLHHIRPVKYILVYPGIYPWEITPNGFLYKLHYLCEAIPNIALICVTAGVDSLFTLHIFQMIGRFRAMSFRILHADPENYRPAVQKCVEEHETLIRCCDLLQKVYGPMILWIMVTNAVILCSITFQFTQIKSISIGRVVMFATYMILKLAQTLMYAWSGTCLTEESENYTKAIYTANWSSNKNFMSCILIMITQRPLVLTACNFSTVSVDVFLMVLNTTLSYFVLLRNINEDN